ncbi:MAG: Ig-like domain-containing protein [Gemmatimonadota bacterium]
MHKVSRSLLLVGVLAFGALAACGDGDTILTGSPSTVTQTGVSSITVSPPSASIATGTTITLAASVVTFDAVTAKTVTWSSSSAAVATVDATGKVTGVSAGSVTITATSTADASKASASAITVTAPSVTGVTVSPLNATIEAGKSVTLAVSVTGDAAAAKTVTWSSTDVTIATVDNAGKVTGVSAGTVTVKATSTADASKSSAALITVTPAAGSANTPNTVAISSVNQTPAGGGAPAPANLNNVAGQVDVTLFISGPAGTLQLIQNCTAGGASSATGDVVVAQQAVAGSQNQSAVTLSYNTAATGTVNSAGVAIVDNTSATPIQVNGNCVLKAKLGTALATSLVQFTLNNANVFRTVTSYTKTTLLGSQGVISATNGLAYNQGDLKVDITPVVYSTVAPGGAAQSPSLATITLTTGLGAKTFGNVAVSGGKFSVTFPSTGATAQNLTQYTTTAVAGDPITVAGMTDAAGQAITLAVPATAPSVRVDNQSPTVALTLAQTLAFGTPPAPRNWVKASYSFAANNTPQADIAYAAGQNTVSFFVGTASGAYPTAQSTSATGAACATGALTPVTVGSSVAQTAAPYAPNYFVRVVENDPLGNVVCEDFGPFGADFQNPNALSVTGGTGGVGTGSSDNTIITTGATATLFTVDSVSGFTAGGELRATSLRNFSTSGGGCVIGTGAACGPVTTGWTNPVDGGIATEGYYTYTAFAQDQAGNGSPTLTRTYLKDATIPTVGGISVPQTLTGGASVTFTSTANDNVDLAASNFDITYSAASGSARLFYAGDNYGPNFDATRVTTAALNATVANFIKQLQGTDGAGAPVAFAAGVGADSGRAATVTVRAIDAAALISTVGVAGIPPINIANSTGFSTANFSTFAETNAATAVANGTSALSKTVTLTAAAVYNSAVPGDAQSKNLPFTQVCFYYVQTATGAANSGGQIPAGLLVQTTDAAGLIGCVSSPDIADVANASRTWTYRIPSYNPPGTSAGTGLGIAGGVTIYAIGVNAAGVGILSLAGSLTLSN